MLGKRQKLVKEVIKYKSGSMMDRFPSCKHVGEICQLEVLCPKF